MCVYVYVRVCECVYLCVYLCVCVETPLPVCYFSIGPVYLCVCVETPLPVCYFSIGPRYGNNHMVISILRTDAKVAYRSGRLHKNLQGRGRLRVRFRAPSDVQPSGRISPTNLPSPQRRRGNRHSVRIIRTEVPRVPRNVFLWRRPDWYATLASVRSIEITIWLFPYLGPMLK